MYQVNTPPPAELVDQYYTFFRRQWNPLARVVDVPEDRPLALVLLGQPLLVVRLDGQFVVLDDLCRHFQAALSLGTVEKLTCGKQVLRCKYHGWAYDINGKCVEIPQLDQDRAIPNGARVAKYPVAVKHGIVWTCLSSSPETAVPDIPSGETSMHLLEPQVTQWQCSAVRMILSALDDYHFAFLHEGVLGDRSQPHAPTRTITREDRALISAFSVSQPANITNSPDGFTDANALVDYTMRVDMPNVISLKKSSPLGSYIVWFAACPRTYQHTDVFWTVSRSYDISPDSDARVIEMESMIQGQDQPVVASQRPWMSSPLPVRGVDDALVEYLRWLRDMGCPDTI